MNLFRSLFDEHQKPFFITVGIFIAIGIVGTIVFANSQQQFLATSPDMSMPTSAAATNDHATLGDSTSTTENSAATQTATSPTVHNTTSTAPVANTPSPSVPFSIASVSLSGASWNCSNGGVAMYVVSAQVIATSQAGGTFQWQVEVTGNPSAPKPISSSSTIPKSQGSYSITAGNPGYIYSAFNARDGQSVRVHVTSPNDIASPRFTIPAGAEASCANS